MIYLELFLAFFWVSLTSFGGGYAALAPIEEQTVGRGWLGTEEFADLLAISQSTPGPIGINAATFVGAKVAGVLGSVCATAGFVLPSFVIMLTLAVLYRKYSELKGVKYALRGLRPASVGLIAAAGVSLFLAVLFAEGFIFSADVMAGLVIFALALLALRLFKLNQAYVILTCGGGGGFWAWVFSLPA
ncbi:MAG: chromate transporter, partial [Oscillospiraceae bacterium]|nr:chromate transporter [Oscillospiraceae bacterium]